MKNSIQDILKHQLPGITAQQRLSPSNRTAQDSKWDLSKVKNSSVLIMLYLKEGEWYFPLIQRASYNGAHSGQVSLPGGKWEPEDNNPWDTAVRETREEIGVKDVIEYIGAITPLYIPFSNYMVYPYIGISNVQHDFHIDTVEVNELIEAPLVDLLNQNYGNLKTFSFYHHQEQVTAPYFDINGYCVWGATAMILSEFSEVMHLRNKNTTDSLHSYNAHISQESLSRTGKALHPDNNQI